MVTIKLDKGKAYDGLKILFKEFEKKGYGLFIPLNGDHIVIDDGSVYWEWEDKEVILEVCTNDMRLKVDGNTRYIIDPRNIRRLWIKVKGGVFNENEFITPYYLYFGANESDFRIG